ncbi:hypothetical protein A0H76_2894 [Hepatospora eriocheir]|uniref:Uncharacterized protein n=1 Tax=Hepatospora eriocheir TaxID=1081669 RepID=A0A1X0Q544_9MICR|nr:hypothetical protein A0H76_2894 [Hepatospora eriocheir]
MFLSDESKLNVFSNDCEDMFNIYLGRNMKHQIFYQQLNTGKKMLIYDYNLILWFSVLVFIEDKMIEGEYKLI